MVFRLDGEVAVITGSSRGIGLAVARAMAQAGATVVISSRKADACRAVADALTCEGLSAFAHACHSGRREELEALIEVVRQRYGRLDHVVANAAVNPFYGSLSDLSDESWSKVLDSNVRAVWWLAKLACPLIAAAGGGSFTVMSSISGFQAHRMLGIYAISKAADMALMRNLALEWGGSGVRVNAIAPGVIRTDFSRALWEDPARLAAVEAVTPIGRIGEPEDIAGTALFLASRAAAFVTGQTIAVDGGVLVQSPVT